MRGGSQHRADVAATSPHRVASLDLLRGAAAFAVAISHFFIHRSGSPATVEAFSILAVEVFFVLSGFVLAPQIIACAGDGRPRVYLVFLVRRWMRTVPPYLVALAAVTILAGQLQWGDTARYALYVQNLFHQANTADYYPVAWSLSVEEWFYVSFPLYLFVVVALWRRADHLAIVVAATAYIAAVTVGRFVAGDVANWGYEVRRVVVFRLDSIAYGVLLFLYVRWFSGIRLADKTGAVVVVVAAGALVLSALAAFDNALRIGMTDDLRSKHLFPVLAALLGSAAIFFFWVIRASVAKWFLRGSLFVGRISYSVYLFHLVVLMLLPEQIVASSWVIGLGVYVVGLVMFCAFFFSAFEAPILGARPRFEPRIAFFPRHARQKQSSLRRLRTLVCGAGHPRLSSHKNKDEDGTGTRACPSSAPSSAASRVIKPTCGEKPGHDN